MKTFGVLSSLALLSLVAVLPSHLAADCGSVPFYEPILVQAVDVGPPAISTDPAPKSGAERADRVARSAEVRFDPLEVTVYEPKQRALILWNGKEQILLLSTDQKATQAAAVLEVIPFPEKPSVKLGDFETFDNAQRLMIKKRMWAFAHSGAEAGSYNLPGNAGKILFEQKMGAHDLAVAEVKSREHFIRFVQDYLMQKYNVPDTPVKNEFAGIIQSYIDNGYKYFAFDVINLSDKTQSRQPIEYRFKTDRLFYPMRISTLEKGDTEVELLVMSKKEPTVFTGMPENQIRRKEPVVFTADEISQVNPQWQGFFGDATHLSVNQWRVDGDIGSFQRDIIAK